MNQSQSFPTEPETPLQSLSTSEPEMNIFVRIWNVWLGPRKLFANVKLYPRWLVPFVVLMAVGIISQYLVTPIAVNDALAKLKSSERFLNMTPEQQTLTLEAVEKRAHPAWWQYVILGPIFGFIAIAVVAGLLLFTTNVLMGGQSKFSQTLAVFIYSSFISIPEQIIKIPLILSKQTTDIRTSLGILFPGEAKGFLFNFLNGADLFGLWQTIIVAIGLAVLCNTTMQKALGWVLAWWILWILIKAVGSGLFGGMLMMG